MMAREIKKISRVAFFAATPLCCGGVLAALQSPAGEVRGVQDHQ
jgi:hypothetical protein